MTRRHDNDKKPKEKTFECDICVERFSRRDGLESHCKRMHQQKEFVCEICENEFSTVNELANHTAINHNQNKVTLKCEACTKTFPSEIYLKKHVKYIHDESKLFRCDKCDKPYSSKRGLLDHITTIHSDEVRSKIYHTCQICNKQCFGLKVLREHMRCHKSKIYECDNCKKIFAKKDSLRQHIQSHHH